MSCATAPAKRCCALGAKPMVATATSVLRLTATSRNSTTFLDATMADAKWTKRLGYLRRSAEGRSQSLDRPQKSACFGALGNAITSRMLSMPVAYITALSNPSPKPAWGTVPYLRRSRYHQ